MTTENEQAENTQTEERRHWAPSDELRIVEARGEQPTIQSLAVPYNLLSEDLGGFRERIMPGAFDAALTGTDEMRVDVEHDANKLLARRSKGTATFASTADGVDVSFKVPSTTVGKDALENVRSRNLDGLSVSWKREGVEDRWLDEDGQVVREIIRAHLTGATLTYNPAYRQTVDSLTLRSLESHHRDQGRGDDADEIAKLRMRLDLAQAECG
jgi:HK97 family phage prohead protease